MIVRRRSTVLTVLAVVTTGMVGILALGVLEPPVLATVPADSLPWEALTRRAPNAGRPRIVLYVAPSCVHCERASITFAREIRQRGVAGLIVSAEGRASTEAYEQRFGLPLVAIDSTHAFGKAAGIRLVPSVVVVDSGGVATSRLVPTPTVVARYVKEAR